MYNIVNWDTNEIIAKVSKLSTAKRLCRNQGHTGQSNGAYYAPVARAQDDNGFCVYNPKFRVGKDDNFQPTPIVHKSDGQPRPMRQRGCTKS